MLLEQRTEGQDGVPVRRPLDDGVWVANVNRREFNRLTADLESFDLADDHGSEVLFHELPVAHPCLDLPRANRDGDLGRAGPLGEPPGDDARTVAGELRLRPIGIPDHDLCLRPRGADDLQDPIGADSAVHVAESPDERPAAFGDLRIRPRLR